MKARRRTRSGARALKGSADAVRKATVILETLCGLRTTRSAGVELGITVMRYYVLETRMLQAMIDAVEPRPRGRKHSEESLRRKLELDNQHLQREVMRLQALHRATQRAVGVGQLPGPARSKGDKTQKTRRPRKRGRGERVLRELQTALSQPEPLAEMIPAPSQGGSG